MNRKKIFICIFCVYLFMLLACLPLSNPVATSSAKDLSNNDSTCITDNIKNAKTIEETEYYKLIYSDLMFYYHIYDKNHDVVMSDGPLNREPEIWMVNDHLVKFTLQAGTGISTQWGYYYDIEADVFSRVFQCIFDQWNSKVAYVDVDKVIVREIFNKTIYYQEFSSFEAPFSEIVEPITNVRFVNDGTCIEVSYLTGSDYKEVVETFVLT